MTVLKKIEEEEARKTVLKSIAESEDEKTFARILAQANRSKNSVTQYLNEKLDKIFSIHTRIKRANIHGMVQCVITKDYFHWTELDCGHFATRNHFSTRWDRNNAWPQSKKSNRFLGGQQFEMGLFIDEEIGEGTAEALILKANTEAGPTNIEKIEMLISYRVEVKKIARNLGLKLN